VTARGAVLALAAALLALCALPSAATPTSPARLLVSGREYGLSLSRPEIAPGRAIVQLLNRGEDDHDLRLRRISRRPVRPTARWPVTRPGQVSELAVRLAPGRYRLWCSVAGHRALGMRAVLRVTRKP
jgi:hypothetical protein